MAAARRLPLSEFGANRRRHLFAVSQAGRAALEGRVEGGMTGRGGGVRALDTRTSAPGWPTVEWPANVVNIEQRQHRHALTMLECPPQGAREVMGVNPDRRSWMKLR